MPLTTTRTVHGDRFEPGNGTSYHLVLVEPTDDDPNRVYLLNWLNAPGGGRAMAICGDAVVHISYLAEKLGHWNEIDLTTILVWLRLRGIEVYLD